MWLLGFSTNHSRNFLILGAIFLVVALAIVLKKFTLCLGARGDVAEDGKPKQGSCGLCWSAVIRTYGLEEMKLATRNFRMRIGVGATSFVYLAELGDGQLGAVKRVMEERGGSRKMFLDEVSVLLRISHPNLVGLLGFCLEAGEQLLLLEYLPNRSLFDRMHTHRGQAAGVLTWSSRLSIARDIAWALDYLHSETDPPIIHRDVKSSNILLIDDDHAKLADFGLCKLGHDPYYSQSPCIVKGSFGYVDVNYIKTGLVSPKSDVYSFGVLLLELITGLKSTQGPMTLPEWTEDQRKSGDMGDLVGLLDPKLKGNVNVEQVKVLVDLANSALVENSEGRPSMREIVDRISSSMEVRSDPELPV